MIPREWAVPAVAEPALRSSGPNDPEFERFSGHILEHRNRTLCVARNTRVAPLHHVVADAFCLYR